MEASLKALPRQNFSEVLVGYENSDDAGVYLLSPETALVQTVDFFSPIVDDPYIYGQIAAANALSDIYAMGGKPRTALSLVAFPAKGLEFSILGEIMRGGLSKLTEAGVALIGGHSIRDDEIKFGYAVTGIAHPAEIKQNNGAKAGDAILLTKPLGTGLIATAIKKGKAAPEHVQPAMKVMTELNKRAAEIAVEYRVHTMTDVTGFGLIGHALEVAKASSLSIEFDHRRIPLLDGALEYSRNGFCAGGLNSNREFYSDRVQMDMGIAPEIANLFFDPQTSGGLLLFVEESAVGELNRALSEAGIPAVRIGHTYTAPEPIIHIT